MKSEYDKYDYLREEFGERLKDLSREQQDRIFYYIDSARNITCEYCGLCRKDADDIPFHRDHIVPKRFFGTDNPENIAWACAPCNFRKGSDRNWKTLSGRYGESYIMKYVDGLWRMPMQRLGL